MCWCGCWLCLQPSIGENWFFRCLPVKNRKQTPGVGLKRAPEVFVGSRASMFAYLNGDRNWRCGHLSPLSSPSFFPSHNDGFLSGDSSHSVSSISVKTQVNDVLLVSPSITFHLKEGSDGIVIGLFTLLRHAFESSAVCVAAFLACLLDVSTSKSNFNCQKALKVLLRRIINSFDRPGCGHRCGISTNSPAPERSGSAFQRAKQKVFEFCLPPGLAATQDLGWEVLFYWT